MSAGTTGRLPDWLVIGAPKAGTTTLAAWLAAHPQAFLAEGKELRYFNLHRDRGEEWYRRAFAEARPDQVAGEATPAYLYFDEVLDAIRGTVPDVRLLAILREPGSRAWSHHAFNRASGIETRTFAAAVADERRADERGRELSPTDPDVAFRYLRYGRYAARLRAVTERFPAEQLLVLLLDDLRDAADATFARVCEHVGIAPVPAPGIRANVGGEPRSYAVQRLLHRVQVQRWPGPVRRAVVRLNTAERRPPAMDEELAEELRRGFEADNRELAHLLGRDLPGTWWPREVTARG